jgi:CRISPR/Cas system-associated endonuclease Cas3-HD
MKRMFLLFSHKLTDEQKEDAKKSLGVEEYIYLPESLQKIWSNIPPEVEDIKLFLVDIKDFLLKNAKIGDIVLIQGDFGAVVEMVEFSKTWLIPVYATTKRISKEIKKDGKIIKISEFKHVRFRRY